jgi:peptidoglycan/xylan/chitin deacetylase (PgdA/CDA1 family)
LLDGPGCAAGLHADWRPCAPRLSSRRNLLGLALGAPLIALAGGRAHALLEPSGVPVLVYHRFSRTETGRTTVRVERLHEHLEAMERLAYRPVFLRRLVDHLRDQRVALPERPVGLSADDGHVSVYTELFPLLRERRLPITLFIYPSVISRVPYALSWDQLREMVASGLVQVQSHTYWHPNFAQEKQRLIEAAYARLVDDQLARSKAVLEHMLGIQVSLLAWPFGIVDETLMDAAVRAGYDAAFSIERRPVRLTDRIMNLPRYMITEADDPGRFARLLAGAKTSPHS